MIRKRQGGMHDSKQVVPPWPDKFPSANQIMPIRPIVRYPDPRLALPAQPVTVFDDALRELAQRPARDHARRARHRDHRAAYRRLPAGRGARPRPRRRRADLCQSGDHLGIARDDPASGRQRLDAWGQRRHRASCAGPDQLSGRPRQPADRGIGRVCARSATSTRSISSNGLFWIRRLSRLKRERLIKRFDKMSRID